MTRIAIIVGILGSILFCPVKAVAELAAVQKQVLSSATQIVKDLETKIEQRRGWILKNKETEQHFVNTLKSFDEHVAAGTEAKTDEERVKWSPMKKLMNEILKNEEDNKKQILANEMPLGCSFHGGPAYSRKEYIAKKKTDYPEIAEWLAEKEQFCDAVTLYGEAYSAEQGSDPGGILDAWEKYGEVFSTYPEFVGFHVWYYAATKYITEGKVPENLQALIKRGGLLEAAEAKYQSMNKHFGVIGGAAKKISAQATANAKKEEWRMQVLSQTASMGSLTVRVVESKIDFMGSVNLSV